MKTTKSKQEIIRGLRKFAKAPPVSKSNTALAAKRNDLGSAISAFNDLLFETRFLSAVDPEIDREGASKNLSLWFADLEKAFLSQQQKKPEVNGKPNIDAHYEQGIPDALRVDMATNPKTYIEYLEALSKSLDTLQKGIEKLTAIWAKRKKRNVSK